MVGNSRGKVTPASLRSMPIEDVKLIKLDRRTVDKFFPPVRHSGPVLPKHKPSSTGVDGITKAKVTAIFPPISDKDRLRFVMGDFYGIETIDGPETIEETFDESQAKVDQTLLYRTILRFLVGRADAAELSDLVDVAVSEMGPISGRGIVRSAMKSFWSEGFVQFVGSPKKYVATDAARDLTGQEIAGYIPRKVRLQQEAEARSRVPGDILSESPGVRRGIDYIMAELADRGVKVGRETAQKYLRSDSRVISYPSNGEYMAVVMFDAEEALVHIRRQIIIGFYDQKNTPRTAGEVEQFVSLMAPSFTNQKIDVLEVENDLIHFAGMNVLKESSGQSPKYTLNESCVKGVSVPEIKAALVSGLLEQNANKKFMPSHLIEQLRPLVDIPPSSKNISAALNQLRTELPGLDTRKNGAIAHWFYSVDS